MKLNVSSISWLLLDQGRDQWVWLNGVGAWSVGVAWGGGVQGASRERDLARIMHN